MPAHWTDDYYGDLYLDSIADLLTPRLSALEAEVIAGLLGVGPADRVLDLACGHGRHAWPLSARAGRVFGLERSRAYLARASATSRPPPRRPLFVRADVRALPLRAGSIDAAFSWYASLFMFDDATNEACLADLARTLRPGGRALVHHANPLRLALEPRDAARRTLPDGSTVEEVSAFDPATGVDRCSRRLVRTSGTVLAGTAELRYYRPSEWRPLSERAGLRLVELTSTTDAGRTPRPDLGPEAPDLIALLEKPR
ncbi:class I SAM-dependent methyltransferase [Anaeromyxobacter oryzae]|uniref:Type 11 methyltransferase n=1 Tax=Anaeromyxobacter oryzae TaxID=2918170 RepID=A0ABM7X4D8_9BACT|nr:class I SAM-dependent methyltransferase [Anaeromyxobacter oryzae]BDG06687.1 type 11 methyltransferase [Anaeromyxobacter oryzae]